MFKLLRDQFALLVSFKRSSLTSRGISTVTLRPYQQHCLETCLDTLSSGVSRIGVSLPTGSGKTTIFISLLSRISPPSSNPAARRALIVVNSIELARQSADQVAVLYPNWTVELEQGSKHRASGNADVTVATYQTLLNPSRLEKFDPRWLKAIIVDEAHHAASPSYRRILSHFDRDIKNPDTSFSPPAFSHRIPIVGFSATFSRHDGLSLGSVFERIVYHRDFLEMIKEKWLCDIRFTSVRAKLDLQNVSINSRTGDFNPSSLAHVVNSDTINELAVKTWIDRAAARKATLIFCVNVAHVIALTQAFRRRGIDARYVSSRTPTAERNDLLASFKAGDFPVLVNCSILTEGTDIPTIDCVLLVRPTRSKNLFVQMIGRGMRLSHDTAKQDCHVIDFVDTSSRVIGVVSAPTLFGLRPDEIENDDETIESFQKRAAQAIAIQSAFDAENVPDPTSITYIEHENPFGPVDKTPHITSLSKFAWVGCGDNIYVLECLGKGHVRINPTDTSEGIRFQAHFTPASLDRNTARSFSLSPFMRSRHILTADTISDAIHGCDTYVTKQIARGPRLSMGLLRTAKWRKVPASESQKKLIAKRWFKRTGADQTPEDQSKLEKLKLLSMGEAANIITRLKHGAQKRYERKLKSMAKLQSISQKEKLRESRGIVSVGPLKQ